MLAVDILFAFLVAILIWLILVPGLGWERPAREGPWAGALFLFLILFLVIWTFGVWARPIGPVLWGGYWVTYLFIGLILALLLAAAVPPRRRRPRTPTEAAAELEAEAEAAAAFGCFFWVLMIFLIFSLVAYYVALFQ